MTLEQKRNLGKMGERLLEFWCSEVGIIVNKVREDETGWDHLLEFPIINNETLNSNIPLDLSLRPLQCLVQVKATDKQPGRWSIKLDNWIRFIETPLPAFFLVLEFDGSNSCKRAYLVHVDEKLIAKVLKKLREIDPKEKKSLHKKKLQFKYNSKNQLLELRGACLETNLKSCIGESPLSYSANKIKTLRTAGYDNNQVHIKFDLALPDKNINIKDYLVDFLLGLYPHLEVIKGEKRDIRFGIKAEEPTKLFESGLLKIIQSPEEGGIKLKSQKESITFDTKVYLPHGIEISKNEFKARFSSKYLDFILLPFEGGENKINVTFNFPDLKQNSYLNDLNELSEILLFFEKATLFKEEIFIELFYKGQYLGKGKIDSPNNSFFNDIDFKMAHAIHSAWKIAKHFNIHHDNKVFPFELIQQDIQLHFMSKILTRSGGLIKISIFPDQDKKIPDDEKNFCIPYIACSVIGQYQIAVSAAILSGVIYQSPEHNNQYEMVTQDVRQCRQYMWKRGEKPPCTSKEAIQFAIDDYKNLAEIILLKGIHDVMLN